MSEPEVGTPPRPSGQWIVEVDVRNFEKEVIERSRSVPVVVDFWASWCEPCKTLGPLLERRAREGAGRFVLARIDIDRSPELAQAFRVQGIPAVLAVVGGKIANGFEGALPEAELDRFLERVAPGKPASPAEEARALAEGGDADGAVRILRKRLREAADDVDARLTLAGILLDANKPEEAGLVLAKLSETEREEAAAKAVLARLEFARAGGDLDELRRAASESPADAGARIELGKALVAAGRHEEGLAELLQVIQLDPAGRGAEAKRSMLEVFDMLGLENPVANDYRFKLSMQVFS